jgi:hypothetical protein
VLKYNNLAPVQVDGLLARPPLRLRGGERLLRDPEQLRVARPRNQVEPELRSHCLHVGALQPPAWQSRARPVARGALAAAAAAAAATVHGRHVCA